jgi:large subunit ribosomal protein L23
VPLSFNKLDLRDYLLHAYNVATVGVRSAIYQRPPGRSSVHGRIFRPLPIKMMTVELTQPFVWPERPEDKSPWETEAVARRKAAQKRQQRFQEHVQKTGHMWLRDELPREEDSKSLRKEAKRLLQEGKWDNKRDLDPKFEARQRSAVLKDSRKSSK